MESGLSIVALIVTLLIPDITACEDGWYPVIAEDGTALCYFVTNLKKERLNYDKAIGACEDLGAQLLPIKYLGAIWADHVALGDASPLKKGPYRMEGLSYGFGKWTFLDGTVSCVAFPETLLNARGLFPNKGLTIKLDVKAKKLKQVGKRSTLNYICVKKEMEATTPGNYIPSSTDPVTIGPVSPVACNASEFFCPMASKCIPSEYVCDSIVDCPGDYLDEKDCLDQPACENDEFRCDEYSCIPQEWRCDREQDCFDGSDEAEESCTISTECGGASEIHQCVDDPNYCVYYPLVCDGVDQCVDGSDELNCDAVECPEGSEQCTETKNCIPSNYLCDGWIDCKYHEDEENC